MKKPLEMVPVRSNVIARVGFIQYPEELHGDLYLEFHSGSVYRYIEVPMNEHQDLLSAKSVGEYYNQEIKSFYQSEQLSADEYATAQQISALDISVQRLLDDSIAKVNLNDMLTLIYADETVFVVVDTVPVPRIIRLNENAVKQALAFFRLVGR